MNDNQSDAVSVDEAARLVGIGRTKLYEAMAAGELPSFKIGGRRLVRRKAIWDWLGHLEKAATRAGSGLRAPAAVQGAAVL